MDHERWRRVEELFHAALEQGPEARREFLDRVCNADVDLRRQVELLLANEKKAGSFLDAPVVEDLTATMTTAASLTNRQLGPYRVLSLLGAGGMGEVYRAHDSKLGRDVAIKTLPFRFANDADRLARLRREARTLASLNHPNVAGIYGLEESEGVDCLVLELVEGEALRGPLPVALAIDYARQVVDGLEAAHDKGIIHRDLKPANVKVTPQGRVKVLDFGLAKAIWGPEEQSGTMTALDSQTAAGRIVGTPGYMSPEQTRGLPVDKRTDIWAFGCLLYEMLTGERAFPGDSVPETVAAVLEREPDWQALPHETPGRVCGLLRECLNKDPAGRLFGIAEARRALGALSPGSAAEAPGSSSPLISIAVLPFVFLNDIQEHHALSLGFADALITMLGSIEELAVLPTSVILRRTAGADPATTCRDLGVRYVLQGNVQKLGAQWRVSMQIFDAVSQRIAFSEKHDFKLDDVFEVQDEIGRRVVESLQTRLPLGACKSRERYSTYPEAYDEFMAGLRESYASRPEVLESAIRHLTRAVEIDPDFALAHATVSYVSMNLNFEFDPQHAWLQKAEYHCRRALELDPALPEAHFAQAWILWSPAKNFQHAESVAALERVLAAQPNNERAHNRMATICLHIGRLEEARRAHDLAQRSNPKSKSLNLVMFYLYSGDFASMREEADAYVRGSPGAGYGLSTQGQVLLYNGELDVAERHLAEGLQQVPDEPMLISLQGILHARRGRVDAALECIRRSLESPRSFGHTHHTYYQIACIYAVLEDAHKAIAWLERCAETGFPCWAFFQVDPHLRTLQDAPRFQRLVADLKNRYSGLRIQRL